MNTGTYRRSRQLAQRFAALLALACVVLAGSAVRADALDGELAVQSAFVNVEGGVYQLQARVQYPLNDQLRAALRDGISLTFDLEVRVERERRFWADAGVVSLRLRRDLSYHTVSERYVVRDEARAQQDSYPTLEAALEALGRVDRWPILVESQVDPQREYVVSVRAGVRRGRMPDALRVLMFWTDDWQRDTGWYSWSLPK
jgi:hypothetical protein